MDTTTIIRIVAGLLFAITLTYLIQRRRKKA
jgi:LPXTG-motif cell wall-anchored protein